MNTSEKRLLTMILENIVNQLSQDVTVALTELITYFNEQKNKTEMSFLRDEAIILLGSFRQINSDFLQGKIKHEEFAESKANIASSVLSLIDQIIRYEVTEVELPKNTHKVELVLDMDFNNTTDEEIDLILARIAKMLKSKPDELKIIQKRAGSVRLILELDTEEQADKLYWLIKSGALIEMGVVDANLKGLIPTDDYLKILREKKNEVNGSNDITLRAKNLIKKGYLKDALEFLDISFEKNNKNIHNKIIILMSSFSKIKENTTLGIHANNSEEKTLLNQISQSILDILAEFDESERV